jgi:1-hydroxycarotenoid 3,4-desaturase
VQTPRVIVIGAGVGGLAASIDLATRGAAVTLLDGAQRPGGKISQAYPGGAPVDAGPTVFTMRWVMESLFADAGDSMDAHLTLCPIELLARHAWSANERLDLFADIDRSADAIGAFAGPVEASGYRSFCARARRVYRALEAPFIRAPRPTLLSLTRDLGLRGLMGLGAASPFGTLWTALGEHFRDPRLRQLFGRYATYSGSSPFKAPSTLMLIAHVEQQGVWLVKGGMVQLADVMAKLAARLGALLRTEAPVAEILVVNRRVTGVRLSSGEYICADAVVANVDIAALASGLFGSAASAAAQRPDPAHRSLSAVTCALSAATGGFPLTRHNVFFSRDYAAEFDDIFRRRQLPDEPTVYVCAQDRGESDASPDGAPERLLVLVNAPADGDRHAYTSAEIERCATRTFGLLARCGLTIHRRPAATMVTTPTGFARLFPATGGALYGQAVHGPLAAFRRPGSRSAIAGLYLAGGSVHPGPGVPMAVLSGRLAAASLLADLTST